MRLSGGTYYYCIRDSFQIFLFFLAFFFQSERYFVCCYDVPMSQDDYNEMLFFELPVFTPEKRRRRRKKRPEKIIISITIA